MDTVSALRVAVVVLGKSLCFPIIYSQMSTDFLRASRLSDDLLGLCAPNFTTWAGLRDLSLHPKPSGALKALFEVFPLKIRC